MSTLLRKERHSVSDLKIHKEFLVVGMGRQDSPNPTEKNLYGRLVILYLQLKAHH